MPAEKAHAFHADLGAVQTAMRSSVTDGYSWKKNAHWECWLKFCVSQNLNPSLRATKDPVPYLQVFGARDQDGRASPSRKRSRSHTVLQWARRSPAWGPLTPGSTGLDPSTTGKLRAYCNKDRPPSRVKSVPVTLIIHALNFAYHHQQYDVHCLLLLPAAWGVHWYHH